MSYRAPDPHDQKLCTCSRRGNAGSWLPPWLHDQHAKVQRVESLLQMRPLSTLEIHEGRPVPETPEEALNALRETGRAATVKTMVALDILSGLQGAHSVLSKVTFDPMLIEFTNVTDSSQPLEVDLEAPSNRGYLEHSRNLSTLADQIVQLKADYGVILGPLVDIFEVEVTHTTTTHTTVVAMAKEHRLKQAEAHRQDGGGAKVIQSSTRVLTKHNDILINYQFSL